MHLLGKRNSNPTIVQVLDSLGHQRGGLTKATYDRMNLVGENARMILVTVAFQPNVRKIFQELLQNGSLPKHTELVNYYEAQRAARRPQIPTLSKEYDAWEGGAGVFAVPDPTNSSLVRYFRDGIFLGLIARHEDKSLASVDIHNSDKPWIRDSRDTMWTDGTLARREYYDDQGRPRYRIHVDKFGKPYLSVWVNENGYEYRTVEHYGSRSVQHGDLRAANASWLRNYLNDISSAVVFTDEPRATFALQVGGPKVRHISTIHTTHYSNNMDKSGGLKDWVRHFTNDEANIHRLVFLTEKQMEDFISDTQIPANRCEVIAHPAPNEESAQYSSIEPEPSRLVCVTRLHADKRVDHVIRAFDIARKNHPNAILDIFGVGPADTELRRLVSDLKLDGRVQIRGHTSAPLEVFAGASATVMATKYEGLSLAILESFAVGTPVIAYDVIYGPTELIEDGINGYKCVDGDISSLADAMDQLLSDERTRLSLRDGAKRSATVHARERWEKKWRTIAS